MDWKIPLFKIYWDENDLDAVNRAIKAGMFWAIGPEIDRFEKMITEYIGRKYAVLFNSGTSALHAAMLAHGIKNGDEVIVPSFTFIATANAALFVGAKPVFADIDEKTFGLDPESVKEKITDKTKAIIPVHYGGLPCAIDEINQIAEDNNLILIEDAAEAFGARIGEKKVGSFGDSSMLSFCANKVITTGEGGALVTDSKDVFDKIKLIRSHGRLGNDYFYSERVDDYVDLGFNFRMSNITASLGLSQMEKVDKIIEMRRKNAAYMNKRLSDVSDIKIHGFVENYFNVYQLYTIRLGSEDIRNRLIRYMSERGIMTKIYFNPIHLTSFYKSLGYKEGDLKKTEEISKTVLSLPIYPSLTQDEMDLIADSVIDFLKS